MFCRMIKQRSIDPQFLTIGKTGYPVLKLTKVYRVSINCFMADTKGLHTEGKNQGTKNPRILNASRLILL